MSIEPCPFWANIFTSFFEVKYVQDLFHWDPQEFTGIIVRLDS